MRRGLIGPAIVLALVAAWAVGTQDASAVVAGSKHDFSAFGPQQQQLCLTCHTAHFAGGTRLLWNHQLSTENYSWSDVTETLGGTPLPTNIKTWSGTTKNCLSCHDGTVAVGSLYWKGYNYTGPNPPKLTTTVVGTGQDMKGNHPVAVPYPYGGVKNTYNAITTGDRVPLPEFQPMPADVKIFADPSVAANNRGMECATCHDPHGTSNNDMLRAPRVGSGICLRCHVK